MEPARLRMWRPRDRGAGRGHGAHAMFDTGVLVIAFILLPAVGLLTLVTLVLIEVD